MTRDREDTNPHDAGREPLVPAPEGWLDRELPPGFDEGSSEAFVRETTARVVSDLREIRAEAARVDEVELPRELLDAHAAPEPSADFVADTLRRLRAERAAAADPAAEASAELAMRRVLPSYRVPPVSQSFVARTLDALELEAADAPAQATAPILAGPFARRAFAVLAAAVLLLAGYLFLRGGDVAPGPRQVAEAAFQHPFGAAMTAQGLGDGAFAPTHDGLLAFARLAATEGGN